MWTFETDPEFQQKLDWIEHFVRSEIEPLDYLFPKDETYNTGNPALMAIMTPLKSWAGLFSRPLFLARPPRIPGMQKFSPTSARRPSRRAT